VRARNPVTGARLLAIGGAIVTALICAGTGAYILREFHTTAGLLGGGFLVLLAVAIALPVPLHAGVAALKENMVVIVPVVVDAMKGGARKTDPPADSPADPPPAKKPDVMPGEGGPI
jgi:hypothetical protein